MMINLTEIAVDEIKKVLDSQEDKELTVRVYVEGMSCSGPRIGLALDKPKDSDNILKIEDIKLIYDQNVDDLLKKNGSITIDNQSNGENTLFTVNFDNPISGCGGSCNCG